MHTKKDSTNQSAKPNMGMWNAIKYTFDCSAKEAVTIIKFHLYIFDQKDYFIQKVFGNILYEIGQTRGMKRKEKSIFFSKNGFFEKGFFFLEIRNFILASSRRFNGVN